MAELSVRRDVLGDGVGEHQVLDGSTLLSRGAAVRLLAGADPALRMLVTGSVRAASSDAVFLETPPVRRELLEQPWGFVLVEAPALSGASADRAAFATHLDQASGVTATFDNLGGDAVLVAPQRQPSLPPDDHAHLAVFARAAPDDALDALWRATGEALRGWLDATPSRTVWLSTSGLGVAWLHVRLDQRPKYYQHAPYRDPDA